MEKIVLCWIIDLLQITHPFFFMTTCFYLYKNPVATQVLVFISPLAGSRGGGSELRDALPFHNRNYLDNGESSITLGTLKEVMLIC